MGPLAGTWFEEFAPLYHSGGRLGLSRAEVDDYEVWEFAAVMGRHLPPEAGEPTAPTEPAAGFDPLAARMEAQRTGAPPPTPPPSAPPPPGLTTLRPVRQVQG